MNAHLSRARDYIAIAESADAKREAYEKAADEIIAAQQQDPTLSYREIGEQLGKGKEWARRLVQWRTSGNCSATPWRYEGKDDAAADSHARKVLRERPEVIEDALAEAEEALEFLSETDEALDARVYRRLKELGYAIADSAPAVGGRERKDHWTSTPAELREQLRVQKESSRFDLNRIRAAKAEIKFLESKEQELGYAPFPELFQDEIARIYAMHNTAPPGRR